MTALDALLSIASLPLAPGAPNELPVGLGPTALQHELTALLERRNGFFALEGALHVLPASGDGLTLQQWNAPDLWRGEYGDRADGVLFFAQDAFALHETGVGLFDAETTDFEVIAPRLAGWAGAVLEEEYWSGWPLARAWQQQHGALQPGQRLMPVQLFVLGNDWLTSFS